MLPAYPTLPTKEQLYAHYHERCDPSRGIICPICSDEDRAKGQAIADEQLAQALSTKR